MQLVFLCRESGAVVHGLLSMVTLPVVQAHHSRLIAAPVVQAHSRLAVPKPNRTPFNFFAGVMRERARHQHPELGPLEVTRKVPIFALIHPLKTPTKRHNGAAIGHAQGAVRSSPAGPAGIALINPEAKQHPEEQAPRPGAARVHEQGTWANPKPLRTLIAGTAGGAADCNSVDTSVWECQALWSP